MGLLARIKLLLTVAFQKIFCWLVLRDYHKKGGKAQCTLKVDLMKAYDSINWDFVLHCLAWFGIPAEFINWVRVCIILVSRWLLKVPYKVFLKGRRVLGKESPCLFT